MVERHIDPALGRVRLKALAPAHLRGLYRERLDSGLSPRTVQYAHTTLGKALKQAVSDGLIPRNPAASVKAPRHRRPEIKPLDREQVRALLAAVSGHRLEALFHDLRHTCATLLLRQGVHVKYVQELLGHADISLRLKVYSHLLPDMGDTAAGAMDAALG